MMTADIIVIGAGIAGASVAAHLARDRKVVVLEMEERPGYHSTGRSAATYEPNYGPPSIRALTRASRGFFETPPQGFAAAPLVSPRETIFVVPDHQREHAESLLKTGLDFAEIPYAEARRKFPPLRETYASLAMLDATTADIDVDLLHQGFLRMAKTQGGEIICRAPAETIARREGAWHVATPQGTFSAPVLINAAGAWGDVIAGLAGVQPKGLQPKRRSMAVVPVPPDANVMAWSFVGDAGETWYAKPSGGRLLVSPAEAEPVEPHDAYADDMTLAEGLARFEEAVDIEVTRLEGSWGGLRSFVPDGNPVCGFDGEAEGFFWLIGQGGYGIQTSPALGELAAALVRGAGMPGYIEREGLKLQDISPARFN
ncbi:NAD(P)/FAD-dependent oxidoreductase [Taklimakanibacter lacteus]|uniref:NAD(P)/FAD-dependent oxidoreductase n=1 Tax=Taklimakanibacter lacteus TaxID=2268456 RepID=UPI000E661D2A